MPQCVVDEIFQSLLQGATYVAPSKYPRLTERTPQDVVVFDADDVNGFANAIESHDRPSWACGVLLTEAHNADIKAAVHEHNDEDDKAAYLRDYARCLRLAALLVQSTWAEPRTPVVADGKPVDVQALKATINAVNYIDSHVRLVKYGSVFKGLCPFHDEKTPSFTVWPDGHWYCFGCGIGGDIIEFVKRWYRCEFKEAVQRLAGGH